MDAKQSIDNVINSLEDIGHDTNKEIAKENTVVSRRKIREGSSALHMNTSKLIDLIEQYSYDIDILNYIRANLDRIHIQLGKINSEQKEELITLIVQKLDDAGISPSPRLPHSPSSPVLEEEVDKDMALFSQNKTEPIQPYKRKYGKLRPGVRTPIVEKSERWKYLSEEDEVDVHEDYTDDLKASAMAAAGAGKKSYKKRKSKKQKKRKSKKQKKTKTRRKHTKTRKRHTKRR